MSSIEEAESRDKGDDSYINGGEVTEAVNSLYCRAEHLNITAIPHKLELAEHIKELSHLYI